MENEIYSVYVKTDAAGHITAVNSSAFLSSTDGWTKIDEGAEERYHHARDNYLPRVVITDSGAYRYRLADGVVLECTEEELREQEAVSPEPKPSSEERIAELEEALALLLSGVTE